MLTKDEKTYLTQVTEHWFDHLKPENWFVQSDQIDQDITDAFSPIYDHFRNIDLIEADLSGDEILAAIILFDQMPRNMFRGDAKAFETDALALSLCFKALANKFDLDMTDIQKSFAYMPLEHSENMNDQELSVSLFKQRTKLDEQIDYAVRHLAIISKFGRFPHRNKALGRVSTAQEEKFLSSGGDNFGAKEGT
ncbi:FIG027190: Putative transmembrane protein [hydrothermal vent metagenome]|uniref:FIG027190: Putative transmembrane protein n=1 Tax=hydrothermal vent metagenome TaxID=652676 RepID=A0A3B1APN3_9ZZZZ